MLISKSGANMLPDASKVKAAVQANIQAAAQIRKDSDLATVIKLFGEQLLPSLTSAINEVFAGSSRRNYWTGVVKSGCTTDPDVLIPLIFDHYQPMMPGYILKITGRSGDYQFEIRWD